MLKILLGLLIFAVALGGSGYYLLQNEINASGPDNPLYYKVKLFSEWVQLQLPASEQEKAVLKLQFMQERLNELTSLENAKKLTKDNIEKIQEGYNSLADDLMNSLKQKAQDQVDAEKKALADKAQGIIMKQQDSLKQIIDKAPDPVKEPINSLLTTVGDAYNRAVLIIQEN